MIKPMWVIYRGDSDILEAEGYRFEKDGEAVEIPKALFDRLSGDETIKLEVVPDDAKDTKEVTDGN